MGGPEDLSPICQRAAKVRVRTTVTKDLFDGRLLQSATPN